MWTDHPSLPSEFGKEHFSTRRTAGPARKAPGSAARQWRGRRESPASAKHLFWYVWSQWRTVTALQHHHAWYNRTDMATTKTDYYEVLSVSRSANGDEIKKSFRKLAMEYHPDRNSQPGAEARFKEISEAYEVLSDTDKRAAYDRYGHAGLAGFDSGRGFEGADFNGFGDIFDAFFGGTGTRRAREP